MDFQLEWAENGLELMARGIRTQPTSQNSTPTSQNLDFEYFIFVFFRFSSVVNLHPCLSTSTWTIFNGTRLDRCGLKSECERFQYGTNLMARKFKKVELNILDKQIIDFRHPGIQASRHPGIQASRHPGIQQGILEQKCLETIMFCCKNAHDRPFRLDETRVTLTKPCKNWCLRANARRGRSQ